jgi:hypothetical protein
MKGLGVGQESGGGGVWRVRRWRRVVGVMYGVRRSRNNTVRTVTRVVVEVELASEWRRDLMGFF